MLSSIAKNAATIVNVYFLLPLLLCWLLHRRRQRETERERQRERDRKRDRDRERSARAVVNRAAKMGGRGQKGTKASALKRERERQRQTERRHEQWIFVSR